ncbi:hypothetical protein CR513_19753, partial [Mucuna pruriens]
TQAYDEEKRYKHMTTNLTTCMNFVLKKKAQALPKIASIKMQTLNMIKAEQVYSEKIFVVMQENQCIANSHYVQNSRYSKSTSGLAMTYTVKLKEWWCDYGEFQALRLLCYHVPI